MTIYEKGIDVSRFQGIVDWDKVAQSGKQFAIIRAVSSNAEGVYQDPYFEQNYTRAKQSGVKVGAYYYSYALEYNYANLELEAVDKALKGKKLEYPIFADIEDGTIASLGREKATELCKYALEGLRLKGWFSGLYTYTNFINAYLNISMLSNYPLWLADYRTSIGYGGAYQLWQYSICGSVPGILTGVDLSNSYFDFIPTMKAEACNGYVADIILPNTPSS